MAYFYDTAYCDERGHIKKIHVKEDEELLKILKTRAEATPKNLTLTLTNTNRQVTHFNPSRLQDKISRLAKNAVESIKNGKFIDIKLTKTTDTPLVLRKICESCVKHKSLRKTALVARVLSRLYIMSLEQSHASSRALYYSNADVFRCPDESEDVLNDICCMLRCTLSCLNVTDRVQNGLVAGSLKFRHYDNVIDCANSGTQGISIPLDMDRVSDISSDALFILLVEKDSTYLTLAHNRYFKRFPCILVSVALEPIPPVATRLFLRMLISQLNLPVFAVLDCDPMSFKLLRAFRSASEINLFSYDGGDFVLPDIKWLGILPSDVATFKIPRFIMLAMEEPDFKVCEDLLKDDSVKKNTRWGKELRMMLKSKRKVEVDALLYFGITYLMDVFLPYKLQNEDGIF